MADAVTTHTLISNKKRISVFLINRSDGTGESGVVKVDKSTLTALDGAEPSSLKLERLEWNCDGMRADLFWDHDTDIPIATCSVGPGCMDFRDVGGLHDTGTGGTGDVILTTVGHTSGDSYMIRLDFILET
jgi:hypothetical protein